METRALPVAPRGDARFTAAAARFRSFFEELRGAFVERDDLLTQIALALLSREHVLMTGPPGTAKSQIAAATLGRILDEETGAPSLYARQFTESTVQTDLVGPIDFKTLMATGRTEHFTDEGMLGAVHAFLDEVLDGRDMLLRTTLNVLQERELKQGTRTTRGRIECALMTTNRYLAEVLETSRDTLLAFVDRIAYVSFVPKGFAGKDSLSRVLRTQLGVKPELRATLTIQDLDALQAAVDAVVVPPELCDALVQLVELVEGDLGAACRADPTFHPTRYLSTRTAVRLGRALRAICVYDKIVAGTDRPLEATEEDMPLLRLTLMLSGPDVAGVPHLLSREVDAREKRQLSILRTEREIFDRCLGRVPRAPKRPRPPVVDSFVKQVEQVLEAPASASPQKLAQAARDLATAASSMQPGAEHAAKLLDQTVAAFFDRALRAGATAGIEPDRVLNDVVGELSSIADNLESTAAGGRHVSRWLRGRAIAMLDEAAALAPAPTGETLEAALRGNVDAGTVRAQADVVLGRLEQIASMRAHLRAQGASEADAGASEAAWGRALARVEEQLVEVWDRGFRGAVARALESASHGNLAAVLSALGDTLDTIAGYAARLASLGSDVGVLERRVVAPRMAPLVAAAFARLDATDRLKVIGQVEALFAELDKGGLGTVIAPLDLLGWSAEALVRAEGEPPALPSGDVDHGVYRNARSREHRVPLAYALVEIALRLRRSPPPTSGDAAADPIASVTSLLVALPEPLRRRMAEIDLGRVTRAVSLLESWWRRLSAVMPAAGAVVDEREGTAALERLASSRFFHVTRDEGALVRFALELRIIGEVFPGHREMASEIRGRLDALEQASARVLDELLRGRSDRGWRALLGAPAGGAE